LFSRIDGHRHRRRRCNREYKLNAVKSPFSSTEAPTPYQDVMTYNNFYEFGTANAL
jgi:DMSO/TMAO reductase YedYZ molybdopterin-dependent catalytic subunit